MTTADIENLVTRDEPENAETTLETPINTVGITAADYRVERAIGAQVLHAVAKDLLRDGDAATTRNEMAGWLRQRAHVITHGQWWI